MQKHSFLSVLAFLPRETGVFFTAGKQIISKMLSIVKKKKKKEVKARLPVLVWMAEQYLRV